MPLDPILITDTRAWLQRAANDLRAADLDLTAAPPLFEDALFHCQQATEKALKAFLTFPDVPFRRTHNLEEIGAACLNVDATPIDIDVIPDEVDRVQPAAVISAYLRRSRQVRERDDAQASLIGWNISSVPNHIYQTIRLSTILSDRQPGIVLAIYPSPLKPLFVLDYFMGRVRSNVYVSPQ